MPTGKDGKLVLPAALTLTWSEAGAAQKPAQLVTGPGACPTNAEAWYPDNASAPTAAVLGPATCDAMAGKTLHFHFGCGG